MQKKSFGCVPTSLLLFVIPTSLSATPPQTAPLEEEIVVTANHVSTPAREVGSSVSVIDREEIERSHATSLVELLRTVPGLEVVQGGGPGKVASLFLRGAGSSQTLVLLDGVPVNTPAGGLADLADLSTLDLERIEVLRGPQSGLYGAEAMGGVVSIFTRSDASDLAASIEAAAGTNNLERGRIAVSGSSERVRWRFSAEDISSDGVSSASAAGDPETDPWRGRTFSARSTVTLPKDARLDFTLRHADGDTAIDSFGFIDGAFRPVDDPNASQHRDATWSTIGLSQPIRPGWTQTSRIAWMDERLEGRDPDSPFNVFRLDNSTLEIETRADVDLAPSARLSVGADWQERQVDAVGAFDESVRLWSLYAQGHWNWTDRLFVTLAARHDDHSTFGGELTGRATASFAASQPESAVGIRLHGSWGTGFRAPSFYDLFFPFGANPGLAPETSEGIDAGVELDFADGKAGVDLTVYQNDFENLIVLDAFFVPQNLGRARARGWELQLHAEPLENLRLDLGWTRTDSENLATGLALPRRPRDRATFTLGWEPLPTVRTSLAAHASRDRVDTGGAPMEDIFRVDAAVDWKAVPGWTPWVRLENLLDDEAEEIAGFTTPGLVASVGLRWSLR